MRDHFRPLLSLLVVVAAITLVVAFGTGDAGDDQAAPPLPYLITVPVTMESQARYWDMFGSRFPDCTEMPSWVEIVDPSTETPHGPILCLMDRK